jgi:hypothetical protein
MFLILIRPSVHDWNNAVIGWDAAANNSYAESHVQKHKNICEYENTVPWYLIKSLL